MTAGCRCGVPEGRRATVGILLLMRRRRQRGCGRSQRRQWRRLPGDSQLLQLPSQLRHFGDGRGRGLLRLLLRQRPGHGCSS